MRARAIVAVVVVALVAVGTPAGAVAVFDEDFESASTVADLTAPGRWSYVQVVGSSNTLGLTTSTVHGGSQALETFTRPTSVYGGTTSKAALGKTGIVFSAGETFEASAWFRIAAGADLDQLYLIDAETTVLPRTPGMRLFIEGGGYPGVNRGELRLPTLRQTTTTVPTGQWFHLRWRMTLGVGPLGRAQIWLDGTKILDVADTTMTPDGMYNSFQYGMTANSSAADATLYVDDIVLERL